MYFSMKKQLLTISFVILLSFFVNSAFTTCSFTTLDHEDVVFTTVDSQTSLLIAVTNTGPQLGSITLSTTCTNSVNCEFDQSSFNLVPGEQKLVKLYLNASTSASFQVPIRVSNSQVTCESSALLIASSNNPQKSPF